MVEQVRKRSDGLDLCSDGTSSRRRCRSTRQSTSEFRRNTFSVLSMRSHQCRTPNGPLDPTWTIIGRSPSTDERSYYLTGASIKRLRYTPLLVYCKSTSSLEQTSRLNSRGSAAAPQQKQPANQQSWAVSLLHMRSRAGSPAEKLFSKISRAGISRPCLRFRGLPFPCDK
jgi:hypothetical protein